ncbi:MAG: TolC family protein [Crocinitomicaceae bacterium]|nr:TolC family protein [Crocinitomicaceae bacterium]
MERNGRMILSVVFGCLRWIIIDGGRVLILFFAVIISTTVDAQLLTLQQAIELAEKSNPAITAATEKVKKSETLEKTAFNLYQPQLQVQAPTGNFYTIGVQQNFDFPTVYSARKKLLKSDTHIAMVAEEISRADLEFLVSDLYIQWQYADAKVKFLNGQQYNFQSIAGAMARSYESGETGMMEKSFAIVKLQEVNQQLKLAQSELTIAKAAVLLYTGAPENSQCDSIGAAFLDQIPTDLPISSPVVAKAEAELEQSKRALALQRNQALPQFFLGYMNQGERNSPGENRLNAGISIPLWFWHLSAANKAARLEVDIKQKEKENAAVFLAQQYNTAVETYKNKLEAIEEYRTNNLISAAALEDAVTRMRKSGETSFTEYLLILSDIRNIRLQYIGLLKEALEQRNKIYYLNSAI